MTSQNAHEPCSKGRIHFGIPHFQPLFLSNYLKIDYSYLCRLTVGSTMFSASILLAQVFTFCPTLVFYNQPDGSVAQINGTPNVSMSKVRNEHRRNPNRLKDWVEVMLVDGRGSLVDQKTYWIKSSEICGDLIGR